MHAVWAEALEEAEEVLAPDLLVAEVTNTIWKYHRFQNAGLSECDSMIEAALGLVDALVPCRTLYREAFFLARTTRQPAYDVFYLALARREDATFLTADSALRKEAQRQGIQVL